MGTTVTNLSYGPLNCNIDLDSPGKRFGNINLNYSSHQHAFSAIPIPIAIIKGTRKPKGDEGPTVLLTAGNHGDEYEGQCILRRLIREIDPSSINGRLIILPALNSPAVRAATRTSPLDGGNLNRSFPGDPDSGPTKAIAGFIVQHLFPLTDLAVDFHSGGSTSTYVNTGFLCANTNPDLHRRNVELMEVFGAPFTMVLPPTEAGTDIDFSAYQADVPFISCELGGAGTVCPTAFNIGWAGLMRVLVKNDVIAHDHPFLSDVPNDSSGTCFVDIASNCTMITAAYGGLFEPLHELGSWVEKGQKAGCTYGLQNFIEPLESHTFESDGVIVIKRRDTLVQSGDHLYCVAGKLTREEVLAMSTKAAS